MSDLMTELHFLRPLWLLGLLVLPPLFIWLGRDAHRHNPWRAAVDAHLLPALLEPGRARGRRLPLLLTAIAATLAVIALAGPAYRQLPQPLQRNQAALVIALDLSAGMLAGDLAPDRLTRARYAIADLLRLRRDGQTALIAYAGDAFTVAPLTDDAATLENLLGALTPDVMPVPGQRLDRAIELAAQLLRNAELDRGQLLVLSHAADSAALQTAARSREHGLRISALGIGSPTGAPVPLPGGGFWKDNAGQLMLAKLQRDELRKLAGHGGGSYAELGAGAVDFAALGLLDTVQSNVRTTKQLPRYRDEGPLLVLLILPLIALLFRRGWLLAPLLLLGAPPQAQAFDWGALWQREDQRAWRAMQEQDFARARQLTPDPLLRGSADYRAGDYAAAAAAFAERDDAQSHYNRGNALARAGQLEAALSAYAAALERNPGLEDAKFNRNLVEQALRQQSPSQPQDQSAQGDGDAGQQAQSSSEGSPQAPTKPQSQRGDGMQENAVAGRQSTDSSQAFASQDADPAAQHPSANDEGKHDEPVDPSDAQDESARQAAQEAHRQAMEQALQQQPADAQAAVANDLQPTPVPLDPHEAEARQAAEQWLQRVPDDPGGLLRRKFALEQRRRQLEESGR